MTECFLMAKCLLTTHLPAEAPCPAANARPTFTLGAAAEVGPAPKGAGTCRQSLQRAVGVQRCAATCAQSTCKADARCRPAAGVFRLCRTSRGVGNPGRAVALALREKGSRLGCVPPRNPRIFNSRLQTAVPAGNLCRRFDGLTEGNRGPGYSDPRLPSYSISDSQPQRESAALAHALPRADPRGAAAPSRAFLAPRRGRWGAALLGRTHAAKLPATTAAAAPAELFLYAALRASRYLQHGRPRAPTLLSSDFGGKLCCYRTNVGLR